MPTAIIIDDNPSYRNDIVQQLTNYRGINLVAQCSSAEEGIKAIAMHKPDLIFLDVEMPPGKNGLEMLREIPNRHFKVIFFTSHDKYSKQAIKESCFDFLLKPLDIQEFKDTMDRYFASGFRPNDPVQFNVLDNNYHSPLSQKNRIWLEIGDEIVFVPIENIVFCHTPSKDKFVFPNKEVSEKESKGAYTTFHFIDKTHALQTKNIGYYEDLLAEYTFMRVNEGYLINHQYINSRKNKTHSVFMKGYEYLEIPVNKDNWDGLTNLGLR